EYETAMRYSNQLNIKPPNVNLSVDALSGGNRQKVILSRWLFTNCKVLIFDEPTLGIDVGVKYEIYSLIIEYAKKGIGIIIISSDLPELLGICTRIYVMSGGKIKGEFNRENATQEKIMELAISSN
ncbi:MAG: ATP-binding cassette domain-containing protein, partial [Ignavibacteria bacterium]|nr:ATP-binding cassette domain-containing protein [Ignavibacteria bacterium]